MNDEILSCFPPALHAAVDAALAPYPDACIYSIDVADPIVRARVELRYFVEGISPFGRTQIELATEPPIILTLHNPERMRLDEPGPFDYCY